MQSWTKRGVLQAWGDTKNPRAVIVGQNGEIHEVETFLPFGLSTCPPTDSTAEALIFPIRGNNNQLGAMGFTGGKLRPKAPTGGTTIYTVKGGQAITLDPDGSIQISDGDGNSFTIQNGRIETNMDIVVNGISFLDHVHPTSSGPTGTAQ